MTSCFVLFQVGYLPKDKWSVPENFTPILPRK
jgi:hypothetical protein